MPATANTRAENSPNAPSGPMYWIPLARAITRPSPINAAIAMHISADDAQWTYWIVVQRGPDNRLCEAHAVVNDTQFGPADAFAVGNRHLDHVQALMQGTRAHHGRQVQTVRERIKARQDRFLEHAHTAGRVSDVLALMILTKRANIRLPSLRTAGIWLSAPDIREPITMSTSYSRRTRRASGRYSGG